jgi:antitoxin ParD1/3/4
MTTVTISLSESLKGFLDRQVKTKGYGNTSEYFRELLRTARNREAEARLKNLLLEGLDSADDIPLTREFWRKLKTEATATLAKNRKSQVKP